MSITNAVIAGTTTNSNGSTHFIKSAHRDLYKVLQFATPSGFTQRLALHNNGADATDSLTRCQVLTVAYTLISGQVDTSGRCRILLIGIHWRLCLV